MLAWPARLMSSTDRSGSAIDPSDEDLAVRAKGGDHHAFNQLMHRHNAALVRFLSRHVGDSDDAEDVAQNTFIAIHRNLHRFDATKSFVTWMFFIARNKAKDHFRRRAVLRWVGFEETGEDLPSSAPDPEQTAGDRDELQRADAFIREMPEGLRSPLLLSAMDGMALAEIGEIMGISAKAAEIRVYRARKLLKEHFFDEG